MHRAHEQLTCLGIEHLAGEQRRLELTCALGSEPELLPLYEPTVGMNPTETDTLIKLVLDLQRELRFAIILVEHNTQVIMSTWLKRHFSDCRRSTDESPLTLACLLPHSVRNQTRISPSSRLSHRAYGIAMTRTDLRDGAESRR